MKSTSHGSCGSQERRAGQLFSKLTTSALEDCSAMEYSLSSAAHVVLSTKREPVSALFAIREGEIRISINSRGDRRMSLRIVNQKYPATSSSHGTRSPMRGSDGSLLGARQSKTNEIGRKRLGQADAHESDPTINPIRNRLHTTHKSRSR